VSTTSVLVGVVIGSGIFRVPAEVATQVGSTGATALLWVLGAAVSLAGAVTVAELTARFPASGGAYVFLREAYGPLTAFLFGWIKLIVTGPAGIAAVALIFATYAAAFIPMTPWEQKLLAAALIVLLTIANIRSVSWSAVIQTSSSIAKVVALAALALLLFGFGNGEQGALAGPLEWAPSSWGGFGIALIAVLWTYVGWVDVSYIAGEVVDPERNFPRAMLAGMVTVLAVYLLINAAYLFVLPTVEIAASGGVAATAAERVFGGTGSRMVAVLVLISTFGSLNATFLTSPRVFYAMARDGHFPRAIAKVHSRYQSPHTALLLYMVLGIAGVMTNTFEQLAQMFILGIWPFYALIVGAIYVVRRREPDRTPAFRAWGYPVLPALFIAISLAMLANAVIRRPLQAGISLGIIGLGVPAYYLWRAAQARGSGGVATS
jgi:amino acid transporter